MSDPVTTHRASAPTELGFGILTVSSSRDVEHDGSGDRIIELVEASGHTAAERLVVADDVDRIRSAVRGLLGRTDTDVVVVNGGTGFSPADLTPEAVAPLLERDVPGFGELFRQESATEIGPAAMLSRALAGIAGRKAVFVLPGSPKAVDLAMSKLILPEVGHLLGQVRRVR